MILKKVLIVGVGLVSIAVTAGAIAYAQDSGTDAADNPRANILSEVVEYSSGEMPSIPEGAIMLERTVISEDADIQ